VASKARIVTPPEAGLDRLLALEAELATRLTAARQEAERVRNEAEVTVSASLERLAAFERAEDEALEHRLSEERTRLVESIHSEAEARVARILTLGQETVDGLAGRVLARVLAQDQGGTAR
jgi:hypothetical protein